MYEEEKIISDAFRVGISIYLDRSDWRPDHELSDIDNNKEIYDPEVQSNDKIFYTPQETPKDLPALESKGPDVGEGLKILTPDQMLKRLQAGSNSQKLKHKIRKLLYLLHRSKKITKTIYKHLINII